MRRDPAAVLWSTILALGTVIVLGGIGALIANDSAEHPNDTWRLIGFGLIVVGLLVAVVAIAGLGHLWWELRRSPAAPLASGLRQQAKTLSREIYDHLSDRKQTDPANTVHWRGLPANAS